MHLLIYLSSMFKRDTEGIGRRKNRGGVLGKKGGRSREEGGRSREEGGGV